MAEKIVSPGVFTQEKDLSFLAEGVSAIGAAIVGPTEEGPAFIPVQITSQNEFNTKFGNGTYYTPYTVQNYLKSAGVVTVVRVLGTTSYARRFCTISIDSGDVTYPDRILAVIGVSDSDDDSVTSISASGTLGALCVTVDGTDYSCSFDTRKENYITNVLTGTVPVEVVYNYPTFHSASVANTSTASIDMGTTWSATGATSMSAVGYSYASTPWIESQNMAATSASDDATYSPLFKFHTLADGVASNQKIKVGIFDIKPADEVSNSDYGQFSIVVRAFSDTDSRPNVLETFNNVTLDPNSVNYLPRSVGDRRSYYRSIGGESKLVYEGDWTNQSSYIRIEMSVTSSAKGAVPMGFGAYQVPINVDTANFTSMSFDTTQVINGETNTRAYRGVDFDNADNKTFLNEIGGEQGITQGYTTSVGSNVRFNLSNYTAVITYGATGTTWSTDTAIRKFIFGFQGGSDGIDPRTEINKGGDITAANTQRFNCTVASSAGSLSYKKAIDALANPDEVDINMIILPGILKKYHSYVSNYAINLCEERGDCFYIMDTTGLTDSITNAVTEVTSMDTNYAATYFPWIKIIDPNTNRPQWAPPSVVMGGVFAFNDKVAQEWFAPAGLNRGGITEAVEAYTRLTHTERDTLYNSRVNPIASFPGQGVVAWGQKTLQAKPSALDRVNVRRLLISLKKYIASSTRYLVFEQNTTATRNRFMNIVSPYLDSVQNRAGLYAFKVIMDDTNNTPDVIDRNQLYGQIYLQPTKTAEFILLDFNILPTGAIFPE